MRYLATALVILALSSLGCIFRPKTYDVDEVSPNGTYRVRVHVTVDQQHTDMFGSFTENGRIQLLKGETTLDDWQWNRHDSLESTFIDDNQSIRWLADDVLRMGDHIEDRQPKTQVTLVNNSSDRLQYVKFFCDGRFEQYVIFDLHPGGKKEISACYEEWLPDSNPVRRISFTGKMASGAEVYREVTGESSTDGWRFKFELPVIPQETVKK